MSDTPARAPSGRDPVPSRPPVRRRRMAVVTGGVVALVVVASLGLLGGFGALFPSPSPPASDFSIARAAAVTAAGGYGSGFSLAWAVGVAPSGPAVAPLNYTVYPLRGLTCGFTALSTGERNLSGRGSAVAGSTPDWTFVFANASGGYLVVAVGGSTATLVGTLEGYGCPFAVPSYAAVPEAVIDPVAATQTALAAGGAAFLARYPLANLTVLLTAPRSGAAVGPGWTVDLTNCPAVPAGPQTGALFQATVNGTTGTLLGAVNTTEECPWPGAVITVPLNTALALTPAFSATGSGAFYYNFTVRSLTATLRAGSLGVAVQGSSGTNLSVPGANLSLVDTAGVVVGVVDLPNDTWTSGANASVHIGDRFVLRTPVDLTGQGDWLVLLGHGYFTGAVSAPIG